ncbi:MAG TPA: GAF domain-containing protein [Fimbriimonadaceae bacterium]|nr:GAF domain-containing protein [Fimbriimonadaceae bacterium]
MNTIDRFERGRLETLDRYALSEKGSRFELDSITALAASICQTPMAALTFVGKDRIKLVSKVGIREDQKPSLGSFSGQAVREQDILIVPYALDDPRFTENELVVGPAHVRFYAGVPLIVDGWPIGTLCVLDRTGRDLDSKQISSLMLLGKLAEANITSHYRLTIENAEIARRSAMMIH